MPTTPASLLVTAGSAINTTTAGTNYWGCASTQTGRSTVEAEKHIPYQYAGIFSKLYVRVISNSTNGASTLSFRKNGSTGNLTLTIPTATSGYFEDTTHTDTIAAGDLICYQTISGGVSGTVAISIISVYFANTQSSEAVTRMAAGVTVTPTIYTTSSGVRFNHLAGSLSAIGSEAAAAQNRIMKAGTLKNMSVYVSANARLNDTALTSRINAANGTLLITIAAGATGLFQDITHSDIVAEGDLVDTLLTFGAGTEAISLWHIGLSYIAGSNQRFTMLNNAGGAITVNAALTNYSCISGGITLRTIESETQLKAREAMTLSNMATLVIANTVTAASTLKLRKNGADGNLLITIAASSSGVFTDLTNSDVIAATDDINYQFISGGTGTSLQFRGVQLNAHIPLTVAKTLSDTKTVGETSFSRLKKAYKTLSETETISGTVARINAALKALSQTFTITENLAKLKTRAGVLKTITQTIVISELRARVKAVWRYQP